MTDAEKAYAAAEKLLRQAIESQDGMISFGGGIYRALDRLPPEIKEMPWLESLSLYDMDLSNLAPGPVLGHNQLFSLHIARTKITDIGLDQFLSRGAPRYLYIEGTRITDQSCAIISSNSHMEELSLSRNKITSRGVNELTSLVNLEKLNLDQTLIDDDCVPTLAGLTKLRSLSLENTDVLDLRPLATFRKPLGRQKLGSLFFEDTTAAVVDPQIEGISKIGDSRKRTQTLFTYLETWVPPASTPRPDENARPPAKKQKLAPQLQKATVPEIREVLRISYPDIKDRCQHLTRMLQQEIAAHALIVPPNDDDGYAEYQQKTDFLRTMLAGIMSLHNELPDTPKTQLADAQISSLRDKLVAIAQATDRAITHLDKDRGTYGSLYKVGLIACISGLFTLVPNVTFVLAAPVITAVIGANSARKKDG